MNAELQRAITHLCESIISAMPLTVSQDQAEKMAAELIFNKLFDSDGTQHVTPAEFTEAYWGIEKE